MHTKKQHIVRKTIIVSVSFLLGIISTVIAAATYDANIQTRATKMFNTIKSNANTLATADQQAYYTLVHLNIQSLIQVLTSVDSSLMLELGTTPDLEDDVIVNQITNTGTTTNTNINTTTNTNNTSQSGSSQVGTTNASSNSGSTSEQRITLNVSSGMIACGNPERNDYTTYSPVDKKVIIQKDYCNSKGGYVWVICSGKVTNTKSISSISNNDTFSCPVVTTTTPITPVTTTNSNTFAISASRTANNTIKVDYNIPASTGYKTCVITAGTSADMLTISNGSVTTGNGMSSGLGSSEVGFSGSKYYGMENDLYLNLYCGKMINAKYTELEKVITTTRLGSLVTAPISNISVSRIPGNTAPVTPGTTTTPTTTTNTGTSTYIATSFESSVAEARLGDTISLTYSVSTDRTCNVVLLKNGQLIREGLSAGTSGVIRYDLKSSDLNTTNSSVEFEMQCSNGSRKTRSIKITNVQGGVTPGTTTSVLYTNIVNGAGIAACNKQIFDKFGTQKYTCSIGGGCAVNGQPKTATNPSANPNLPGVCIPKSEWDAATPTTTTTTPTTTTTTPTTTTTNSNTFNISASRTATNTIKVDYNIPASTGYKTCVITAGTSVDMLTITNGSVTTGNGMSSGLGSSDVGFNGSKYYGVENDLYLNLYCAKVMNAKYSELEKVITATRLSSIVTTPISNVAVSQIPGNTTVATASTTTIPVPSITASKTTATAGETITFTWVANDPAPVNCKTIINNVTQEPPYLQGASGTIPVANVPAGTYAIKIECKYSSGYVRTSPVINVLVNPVSGTVASVAPTCNDPVKYYQYYNPDVPADQGLIHWYKYGYKEQRRSCWPAPVSCAAGGPASWGTNCSGSWPTTVSGADALVIDNIAPGIGEYKATCINGSWTNAVFSCH